MLDFIQELLVRLTNPRWESIVHVVMRRAPNGMTGVGAISNVDELDRLRIMSFFLANLPEDKLDRVVEVAKFVKTISGRFDPNDMTPELAEEGRRNAERLKIMLDNI